MTTFLYPVLAAVFASGSVVLAKAGAKKGDSGVAAGISGIVVCLFAFFISQNSIMKFHLFNLQARSLIFVLVVSATTAASFLCFFKALWQAEAVQVVPIEKCYLIIGWLLSFFVLKDKFTTNMIISAVLIVVGAIVMLVGEGAKGKKSWMLFALLAAIFRSVTDLIIKMELSGINFGVMRFYRILIGIFIIWGIVIATGKGKAMRTISFLDGVYMCGSGACVGLDWIFYNKAAALVANTTAMAVYRINILITVILTSILLKEKVSGRILLGALIFVAGLEFIIFA